MRKVTPVTSEAMEHYFGERWDAPAFDDAREVPTPVGEICGYCEEAVAEGDSGILMTFLESLGARQRPVHIECWLRAALGDICHLDGRCTCFDAENGEHDDRPWREQGRATMEWVRTRDGGRR